MNSGLFYVSILADFYSLATILLCHHTLFFRLFSLFYSHKFLIFAMLI